MKVLVVDDSSTMRRIVSNVIKQIGVKSEDIYQAVDGKDAIKVLENIDNIDLILTDWNMPNMNGLELVKHLRSNIMYSKTPIIMITTEGGKSEVITALKSGVNNYIVKPFSAEVLKGKIDPFFKNKSY